MARLSIRVKFNEGRVGVSLNKLQHVVGEVRQFFDMLGNDVGIAEDIGGWQGFDFQNHSLSFVASKPVAEPERPKVRQFNRAVLDITYRRENAAVKPVTRAQFAKIAKPIDPDEAVRFGIYEEPADELVDQAGTEPSEWLDLTRDKADAIFAEIEAVVESYGAVQGVIHSVFLKAQPPHFRIRELSTGHLIYCTYSNDKYFEIAKALQVRDVVVHAYGRTRTNKLERKIESMFLDRLDVAESMSDEELHTFLGSAPEILGSQTLQQFIDDVRDRGE